MTRPYSIGKCDNHFRIFKEGKSVRIKDVPHALNVFCPRGWTIDDIGKAKQYLKSKDIYPTFINRHTFKPLDI